VKEEEIKEKLKKEGEEDIRKIEEEFLDIKKTRHEIRMTKKFE
jgi:hypothetical protein